MLKDSSAYSINFNNALRVKQLKTFEKQKIAVFLLQHPKSFRAFKSTGINRQFVDPTFKRYNRTSNATERKRNVLPST